MDLREIAMSVQQRNQTTLTLLQQMGQYTRTVENGFNTHPAPAVQAGVWGPDGGFLGNLTAGLGMAAGVAAAEDDADDPMIRATPAVSPNLGGDLTPAITVTLDGCTMCLNCGGPRCG